MQLVSATIVIVQLVSMLQIDRPVMAEAESSVDFHRTKSLPPLMEYLRKPHDPQDQIETVIALEHAGIRMEENFVVSEASPRLGGLDECAPLGTLFNAIHFAAIGSNNEALKLLIQKGLDFKAVGLCSKPIYWAAFSLNAEGLEILLSAGVPANADFERQDLGVLAAGRLASFSAEERSLHAKAFLDVIQTLVRHGYPLTKTRFLFSLNSLEKDTFKKIKTELATIGFDLPKKDVL